MKTKFKGVVTLFSCLLLFTSASTEKPKSRKEINLILVRPTVEHLENIVYLVKSNLITIPEITLTGIYHESDKYDYNLVSDYIKKENIKFATINKVSCDIDFNEIYKENSCSKKFREYFDEANGIIFFGGPDVTPKAYGKKNNLLTDSKNFITQYFELSFVFHLLGRNDMKAYTPLLSLKQDFTVMGICQGLQVINIAAGGSLIQDIPTVLLKMNYVEEICRVDSVAHYNYWTKLPLYEDNFYGNFHSIMLTEKSILTSGMDLNTNFMPKILSAHHQCIDSLSPSFKIIARSASDSIPEAIQHRKFKNVFALQFHPELHLLYDTNTSTLFGNHKTPQLGKDYLIKHNSYNFHASFWHNFSDILRSEL